MNSNTNTNIALWLLISPPWWCIALRAPHFEHKFKYKYKYKYCIMIAIYHPIMVHWLKWFEKVIWSRIIDTIYLTQNASADMWYVQVPCQCYAMLQVSSVKSNHMAKMATAFRLIKKERPLGTLVRVVVSLLLCELPQPCEWVVWSAFSCIDTMVAILSFEAMKSIAKWMWVEGS